MAVTSAMSAELVAVSSIFTYDIYRTYFNPNASGKKLIFMTHLSVIVFAYAMAGFAIGLYYAGISMGYLYELMGIIISGAVLPSVLTLLSKKQNVVAVTVSPMLATGLAIMAWLVCTKSKFGELSVATTFEDDPMLTGNVVALLSPMIFIPIFTYVFKPQNFDWRILQGIRVVDEQEELTEFENVHSKKDSEYLQPAKSHISVVASDLVPFEEEKFKEEALYLRKSFKIGSIFCVVLTVCLVVLWPMPMYGQSYIFSKRFFTGWIVVLFIWIFFSAFIVIIAPIVESYDAIYNTMRGMFWDVTGQTYKLREWQDEHPEKLHAVNSQVRSQLLARSNEEYLEGSEVVQNLDEVIEKKE